MGREEIDSWLREETEEYNCRGTGMRKLGGMRIANSGRRIASAAADLEAYGMKTF